MSLYTEIAYTYNQLVQFTDLLNQSLLETEVIHAQCYKLPAVAGDMSDSSGWEFIEPESFTGFTALSMATGAFSRFTPDYQYSAKYPFRLPGVIQLNPVHRERISELVYQCNHLKLKIKTLINSSTLNQTKKRELIQSVCPNAITLQIYRLIKTTSSPVKRVGFTWCNKNSMRRIRKSEFLDYLQRSKNNPPSGQTKAQWAPWVDKEIALINKKAGEYVRIKRPLPIVPKLNISFIDDTKTIMFYGHLPVIIFTEQPIKIRPLKCYINERNKKQLYDYLIKRLYVVNSPS
ncbi:DNA replication terminus site-binding protein [Pseudoalteromonas sp. Angola-30]|uniref:DNA replication terminus site-binding protein n=1 Tax=Pseudoalteromonas sp. Angola-30 TaxID=3025341 RepID=UPI002358F8CA|nr:DNA replication terminus site-binding protein [Pseudoalteromonas sp. Angola-30]MDC9526830.1 DNA replication terminus site-binding protein [Pseudoalteromonas sp. Angola-30]